MRIIGLALFLFLSVSVFGQLQANDTRTQLEGQRKELLQKIDETEKELIELRSNKKVTLTQLQMLQEKLVQRQKLIENINLEVAYIDHKIEAYESQIITLKGKLEKFKLLYTRSIRYTYKSRTTFSMLAFVCSSGDFNDAVRRMRYLKLMRAARQQQSEKIKATHAEIYHKLDLLHAERAGKDKLLAELTGQNETLSTEKEEANKAVKDLSGREKELRAELLEKKKSAKRIDDAIRAIIKREMQTSEENSSADNGNYTEEDEANPTNAKKDLMPTLPKVELQLARSFEKSKGKLMWPVLKGNISCHFGKYNIKNIEYFNNGVDIKTVTYGIVNSVYEGNISSVVEMDGKVIVIVQHGNYFTVYNNLLRGMVLKNQHVMAGQPLGLVATNEDGYPTLNFQIWKSGGSKHETTMLNPEEWMGKMK